jgi:hypothetical protein
MEAKAEAVALGRDRHNMDLVCRRVQKYLASSRRPLCYYVIADTFDPDGFYVTAMSSRDAWNEALAKPKGRAVQ